MGTHRNRSDKTALAPVVGILLLLSLTVLLGATIGVFVMELDSPDTNLVTAVDLTVSLESDGVVIEHEGGSAVPVDNTVVEIAGSSSGAVDGEHPLETISSLTAAESLTASSSITINASDFTGVSTVDFDAATIRFVRTGQQGRTVTIVEWTGPDA